MGSKSNTYGDFCPAITFQLLVDPGPVPRHARRARDADKQPADRSSRSGRCLSHSRGTSAVEGRRWPEGIARGPAALRAPGTPAHTASGRSHASILCTTQRPGALAQERPAACFSCACRSRSGRPVLGRAGPGRPRRSLRHPWPGDRCRCARACSSPASGRAAVAGPRRLPGSGDGYGAPGRFARDRPADGRSGPWHRRYRGR